MFSSHQETNKQLQEELSCIEEAQNILKLDPIQAARLQANTKKLFDNPTTQLYKGYVGHRDRGCGILL